MATSLEGQDGVDYRKLLKIALSRWLESEGVCWRADNLQNLHNLTDEDRSAVQDVLAEIERGDIADIS